MSRGARWLWVVSLLLSARTASVRGAEPAPSERLVRARLCYAALDFDCAADELAAARAEADALTPADRIDVLRLSAEVALAADRSAAALSYLTALLELRPGFAPAPGAWPPAWLATLDEARRRAPDRAPPRVRVDPISEATVGAPFEVHARVEDRSGVARVVLYLAPAGGPEVSLAMVTADGVAWRAVVPAELAVGPALSLRVEAWDRLGNGPNDSAAARYPVALAPAPEVEGPAFYETWWFWTAVGAVAVGGGLTAAVLASGEAAAGPKTREFGDISVMLEGPR